MQRSIPMRVLATMAVLGALLIAGCESSGGGGPDVDVTGRWRGTNYAGLSGVFSLVQDAAGDITGTYGGGAVSGSISGRSIVLSGSYDSFSATGEGEVSEDGRTMTGTWTASDNSSGTWSATKL